MSHDSQQSPVCLNCGYTFINKERYCPECGQKNSSLNVSLKHLFEEILEGFLHLDVKVFTTLKHLLFKPGFLTKEFNEGKRIKYVPPVRLYVFISFIFFFVLTIAAMHKEEDETEITDKVELGPAGVASLKLDKIPTEELARLSMKQITARIDSLYARHSYLDRKTELQKAKILKGGKNEFRHLLIKYFSYSMFLIMPFFALLFFLFNRKSFFINSLIFSIHFHSFLFLLLIATVLLNMVYPSPAFIQIVMVLGFIYVVKSMRFLFPQKKMTAILKTFIIMCLYSVLQVFVIFFLVIITLILA